jgi:carbon monoxide dehydrogenase subunit G
LEFTGRFATKATLEKTAKNLSDIKWISECLPNLGKLEIVSDGEFFASFKVDLSDAASKMHLDYLTRLTVRMHFKYMDRTTNSITLQGSGRAAGSKLDIILRLNMSESNAETLVAWTAQVEFGKLLKLFGEKLLQDVSKKTVNDLTNCLTAKLAAN